MQNDLRSVSNEELVAECERRKKIAEDFLRDEVGLELKRNPRPAILETVGALGLLMLLVPTIALKALDPSNSFVLLLFVLSGALLVGGKLWKGSIERKILDRMKRTNQWAHYWLK